MTQLLGVHPNIYRFIDGLKMEQANEELTMAQIEAGQVPPARKPNYVREDLRLFRLVKKFNEEIAFHDGSFLPYLKSVAHNTHY